MIRPRHTWPVWVLSTIYFVALAVDSWILAPVGCGVQPGQLLGDAEHGPALVFRSFVWLLFSALAVAATATLLSQFSDRRHRPVLRMLRFAGSIGGALAWVGGLNIMLVGTAVTQLVDPTGSGSNCGSAAWVELFAVTLIGGAARVLLWPVNGIWMIAVGTFADSAPDAPAETGRDEPVEPEGDRPAAVVDDD